MIGVEDNTGVIKGVEVRANTVEWLTDIIMGNTEKAIYPYCDIVNTVDGKVIVLTISESDKKPHRSKIDKEFYKRFGKESRPVFPTEIEQGICKYYDYAPVETSGIDDIDSTLVESYFRATRKLEHNIPKITEVILGDRHWLTQHKGKLTPSVAGILLFGKLPQIKIPGSIISVAAYEGTDKSKFRSEPEVIKGTLVYQIEEVKRYIKKYLGPDVNIYPLDESVWEALANAIVHRDYFEPGNVQISIFSDRIELFNPGCLPGDLTIATFEGRSIPRNPLLFEVFRDLNHMERQGSGVERMKDGMRKKGLIDPEFEESKTGNTFRVIFWNKKRH